MEDDNIIDSLSRELQSIYVKLQNIEDKNKEAYDDISKCLADLNKLLSKYHLKNMTDQLQK